MASTRPLTVRAQNFVGAYLYQRGRQTAQVGKQRAVAGLGPVSIGAGVGGAYSFDIFVGQHRVQRFAAFVAFAAGGHVGPGAEQQQRPRLGTALLLELQAEFQCQIAAGGIARNDDVPGTVAHVHQVVPHGQRVLNGGRVRIFGR